MRTLLLGLLTGCVALYAMQLPLKGPIQEATAKPGRCGLFPTRTVPIDPAALTALPVSTILSKPDLAFYSTQATPDRFELGFLQSDKSLAVQAQVILSPKNGELTLRLAQAGCAIEPTSQNDSALLALEHLYGVVLASGVETRFRIELCESGGACSSRLPTGASQYAALREIAWLRENRLATTAAANQYKPWISLEITHAEINGDAVAARIDGREGPVAGRVVAFAQAPHLGCFATTSKAGVASCVLEDYHGHDGHDGHEHDQHERDGFTVTMTGGAEGEAVVLPIARTFDGARQSQR